MRIDSAVTPHVLSYSTGYSIMNGAMEVWAAWEVGGGTGDEGRGWRGLEGAILFGTTNRSIWIAFLSFPFPFYSSDPFRSLSSL